MTDFFQVPPPLELQNLPESADLGDKRVEGAKARVYHLLRIAQERRLQLPLGRHLAPAGEVPRHIIVEPWSGGSEGMRRVRELRALGVPIEHRPFQPPDGGDSATNLYRLAIAKTPCLPAAPSAEQTPVEGSPLELSGLRFQVGRPLGSQRHHLPLVAQAGINLYPLPHHLEGDGDPEAYKDLLRAAYSTGVLVPYLQRFETTGIDFTCEYPWVLEVLREVLGALGAQEV
ncbi:MAG: hypothetical protein K0U98_06150 [Deltaproteobacteria bacterium]|nr:hypothetical protein [Deltaproteobacteria bacterium]